MFIKSYNSQTKELTLSIYNNDVALINEVRDISKAKLNSTIEYSDISKLIYENSVIIQGAEVSQINFNYKCYNDNNSKNKETICSKCLNTFIDAITIEAKSINSTDIRLYYLSGGIKWTSSYTLILKSQKLDLEAWINISNKSGISYNHANLKCIAGDVNISSSTSTPYSKTSYVASSSSENTSLENLEDYYIYNLKGLYNLENNSTKRIKSFLAEDISYSTLYDFGYYNNSADILIEFENTQSNNLGTPMPSGVINVYTTSGKTLAFLGSDSIKNTSIDENLSLNIGKAFDITCERKIIDYQKYDTYEFKEIELIISNDKNEEVPIKICYPIFAPWESTSSTENYSKDNNGNPCFMVNVSANDKKSIFFTYKVKIS
ncbi:hypothetical protein K4H75_09430 [Clostridium chauvoei]|uniref:DUF4139 domain-containing protein n=1 Tax=Clostridium chauvoei TaxID=46867 RepID=UPI001C84F08A|nr:hypothetical protein [Clostridium chauvoei]MBX7296271.1 hypothetical protein [Clostridium chauvoei]